MKRYTKMFRFIILKSEENSFDNLRNLDVLKLQV